MKLNKRDIKGILSSIDLLLDMKTYIRSATPTYELTPPSNAEFLQLLQALQKSLTPLFSKYLQGGEVLESESPKKEQKEKVIDVMSKGNIALISSNSAKNILKEWGIDPRNLIVIGGPLFPEDYQKVNPTIPENALKGIQKKCKGVMDSIKGKNWDDKDLYFLYETENIADTYTYEKLDRVNDLIGKKVKVIKISSWDNF